MYIYETVNCYLDRDIFFQRIQYLNTLKLAGIRCNLSKLPLEKLAEAFHNIKEIKSVIKPEYQILIDLAYPVTKPRIFDFNCDKTIHSGEKYVIKEASAECDERTLRMVIYLDTIDFVKIDEGDIVYYSDGVGAFRVRKVLPDHIIVQAINTFVIYKNKSISFPTFRNQEILNQLEKVCVQVKDMNISYLLSFVSAAEDIVEFRKRLSGNFYVISKIESTEGYRNLEEIAKVSDGLLVARGDLAVYESFAKLFHYTKTIVNVSKKYRIETYCATDILLSLENLHLPSRADIVDISYNMSLGIRKFILPNYIKNIERVIDVLYEINEEF